MDPEPLHRLHADTLHMCQSCANLAMGERGTDFRGCPWQFAQALTTNPPIQQGSIMSLPLNPCALARRNSILRRCGKIDTLEVVKTL